MPSSIVISQRFTRWLLLGCLLMTVACQSSRAASPAQIASPVAVLATQDIRPSATVHPTRPPVTATPRPLSTPTPTSIPPSPTPTFTSEPVTTTLLFTGIIVPARCVQDALDTHGNYDYPYEEVKDIIAGADLAIGTFNATMSDQVTHTGCIPTYQLVGSPKNADAMQRAGFDLMSVATNHIKDCGPMKSWCDYTFFDTLDNLRRVGIQYMGAGKNLQEALQPVVMTVNGVRFGFVSLGDSKLDEVVFAGEDHPGIARLTEENMQTAIAAARQVSDVVIAMPHWGSEDIFVPNWLQRDQARYTVAAGADLVIGNHTHVVQAYQELDGVMVFYGLGNFVFDQMLRDHRQAVILLVKFRGRQFAGFELIPTHVDRDGRVHIAGPEEAAEILHNIDQANQVTK